MQRLGIRDPFTSEPYQRIIRLLYHDRLAEQHTTAARDEFLDWLNSPLTAAVNQSVYQTLIDDGIAFDLEDAMAFMDHQTALERASTPTQRVELNAKFAAARRARRAVATPVVGVGAPGEK